jgi:hypothetical protein
VEIKKEVFVERKVEIILVILSASTVRTSDTLSVLAVSVIGIFE